MARYKEMLMVAFEGGDDSGTFLSSVLVAIKDIEVTAPDKSLERTRGR
jgi:hypothetical protein